MRIRIALPGVLLYAFCLSIAFLAGMSFGGVLRFLFWFLVFYPLSAFVYTVYTFMLFRFHEDFSHEHPVKGDTVLYRLSFSNEAPFTRVAFGVKFRMVYPGMTEDMKGFAAVITAHTPLKKEYRIRCPYRGIYTVGLESLYFQDPLGWLSLEPAVWYRTFYVYPRVIRLAALPTNIQRSSRGTGIFAGLTADPTLLQALTDYRAGEPVKHMAWKKFMAAGVPYLKTYEKSALPGITICIDLRRPAAPDQILLAREDCSVEILVAVVHYLLQNRVPVSILGMSETPYYFSGSEPEHFHGFYQTTLNIGFAGKNPPLRCLNREKTPVPARSLLFITHILDADCFELMSAFASSGLTLVTLFNQTGLKEEDALQAHHTIRAAREKGSRIICVNNSETIKEDLERA